MPNESTIRDLKDAIREVVERKRQVDEEHNALLTTLRYFEGQGNSQSAEGAVSVDKSSVGNDMISSSSGTRSDNSANELREAIYEILSAERPLHRRVIYGFLREKGIYVSGKDPLGNVSAHLSLDPRFENVGRGLWDLATAPPAVDWSEWDDEAGVGGEQSESDDVPW